MMKEARKPQIRAIKSFLHDNGRAAITHPKRVRGRLLGRTELRKQIIHGFDLAQVAHRACARLYKLSQLQICDDKVRKVCRECDRFNTSVRCRTTAVLQAARVPGIAHWCFSLDAELLRPLRSTLRRCAIM